MFYLPFPVPSPFLIFSYFRSVVLLSSTTVSEPVCIFPSVPLWDSSQRVHREEHQEELPRYAPVYGEISSNWSPGRTCQPQNGVWKHCVFDDSWSDIINLKKHYIIMCVRMSVSILAATCVCMCVFFCDSSSETGDEWASSLGAAGAIFSTGLYNGTGGGLLWKYIDDKRFRRAHNKLERYSVCRSTFESAQAWICKSKTRFVHEGA